MPRMTFPDGFDWHVKPNVTISYKPGVEYLVPQKCIDEAIAKGKGQASPSKSKATPDASQ